MADASEQERSLPPTPRRIAEARRAGELAISRDAIAAVSFASGCGILGLGASAGAASLMAYLRLAVERAPAGASVTAALHEGGAHLAAILCWPLAAVAAGAAVAGLVQTRGRLAWADWRARALLSPSFLRRIGRHSAASALADVTKIGMLLLVAGASLHGAVATCAVLPRAAEVEVGLVLAAWVARAGSRLAFALLALGAADYGWQVFRHRRRLRMSHQEARREERESEGDPELKAERHRRHCELSTAGALADAAKADLVVIEPGIAAAAVAWRGGTEPPVLLVRGAGLRARRIEALARQAGVPVCLDPAMVRALGFCAEGAPVPEGLYALLARVVASAQGCGREVGEKGEGQVR